MNVNGIRSAHRKGLASTLADIDADVVCFQEVRASLDQIPALGLEHGALWLPAERKGYSGVGTLTREAPTSASTGMGSQEFDGEGRVIRTDLHGLSIINVYAPSGTTGDVRQAAKYRFMALLFTYLEGVLAEGREVLVCGDINIAHQKVDLKNWRTNQRNSGFLPEERAWFGSLLGRGFVDVVRELAGPETAVYSWWTARAGARERDIGWRIDYQLATP
ncbi:MAG TPA: exodeoxyribonuclease III, partial [Trueperaceae bacterium]|nr:exodeoxyribonuclease III [Trueperaceae bacterium]